MHQIFYRVTRWLILATLVTLAAYFLYTKLFLIYTPKIRDVDARLPDPFHSSSTIFWSWVLGLGVTGACSGYWAYYRHRTIRRASAASAGEPDAYDPEIGQAWEAVAGLRRGREQEPVYLIIAEDDSPSQLIAAAGLDLELVAPEDTAPIRGFRTLGALFLQCKVAEGARFACRALASTAELSAPRGIVVQIPAATLMGPRSSGFGQVAREILRGVADSTTTRCPVYVVISGMEGVPGFLEFARRHPPEYRASARFGFSLPGGDDPVPESLASAYDRLVAWCEQSNFDLMETGPLHHEGNESLYLFNRWCRLARGPILQVLETAALGGDDPSEVLGCYFAATGAVPEDRAFAESLIQAKVMGNPSSIRWSLRTLDADSASRRSAVILGTVAGSIALVVWALIFYGLRPTGQLDPALAVSLALAWIVCWYLMLRGPRRKAGA